MKIEKKHPCSPGLDGVNIKVGDIIEYPGFTSEPRTRYKLVLERQSNYEGPFFRTFDLTQNEETIMFMADLACKGLRIVPAILTIETDK